MKTAKQEKVNGEGNKLLGAVTKALKQAGINKEERDTFMQEATSGNYGDLLTTAMRWVVVE